MQRAADLPAFRAWGCEINSIPRRARTSFQHGSEFDRGGRCKKKRLKRALFGRFCVVLYEFRALFVRFFAALPVHRDGMERAARRRRAARWRHDQRQALPLHVFNFDTSFLGMQCAGVHRTRRAAARRASARPALARQRSRHRCRAALAGTLPPISGADFSFFVRRGRAFARHAPRAREGVVSLPDAAAITRHSFLARR